MSKITNVVTLKQYADKHELDVKRLRRLARKNEWPDADNAPFKFGGEHGLWCVNATAPAITLPAKSERGSRRSDGRQRYIVYVNNAELTAINAMGVETVDPRVAAKLRRAQRALNAVDDAENERATQIIADAHAIAGELENDDNG